MSREAMKMALDQLKRTRWASNCEAGYSNDPVIAALEAELAKPEQEPFKPDWANYRQGLIDGAAQAKLAKPEQEPVKCICGYSIGHPLVSSCKPRKEYEIEQARREERGWCHQLVWDYGFSRVDNEDVQEACSILAKQILARSKK